jgi:hypothetical protein
MFTPPHVGVLADRLGELLERVARDPRPEKQPSVAGTKPAGASIVV